MRQLALKLAEVFLIEDFRWKREGELFLPTVEDIQEVLERSIDILREQTDDAQLEVGRIIIQRKSELDKYDIFVYMGEVAESDV